MADVTPEKLDELKATIEQLNKEWNFALNAAIVETAKRLKALDAKIESLEKEG